MRLIDVNTLTLVQNPRKRNGEPVDYAILSHRWLDPEDEVSCQDMQHLETAKQKQGWHKIQECCRQAGNDGLHYIWIDTCCIDKTSSAELQEALNSMYRWYEESAICYALLKDVHSSLESISADEWFTRGWTLQELIAPKQVEFYDANWHPLGDRATLRFWIHAATNIDEALLEGKTTPQYYSIGERMSWAARRVTTRIEDRAYSLFGLFGVNMPMLYGEGTKAFIRLQEEIIKVSDDYSIFSWTGITETHHGLLAPGPDAFVRCSGVQNIVNRKGRSAFTSTNRGISITLDLTPYTMDTYVARLHCGKTTDLYGIFLRRLLADDQYARVKVDNIHFCRMPGRGAEGPGSRSLSVFVRQADVLRNDDVNHERIYGFRICEELVEKNIHGRDLFRVTGDWDPKLRMLTHEYGIVKMGVIGELDISKQRKAIGFIKLGFDFDFNPVVFLTGQVGLPVLPESDAANRNRGDNILSDEKLHASRSFAQRTPFDTLGWNQLNYENKGIAAPANSDQSVSMFALKGDRIDGLNVLLGRSKFRLIMKKTLTNYGLVWDFSIQGLMGPAKSRPGVHGRASK